MTESLVAGWNLPNPVLKGRVNRLGDWGFEEGGLGLSVWTEGPNYRKIYSQADSERVILISTKSFAKGGPYTFYSQSSHESDIKAIFGNVLQQALERYFAGRPYQLFPIGSRFRSFDPQSDSYTGPSISWEMAELELREEDDALESIHFAQTVAELCSDLNLLVDRLLAEEIDHSVRRQLIIEAETHDFPPELRPKVLNVLWEFVESFRDSNDPEDLIAVGSAIRKYVGLMPVEDMNRLVRLLEPGHRTSVPIEVLVEATKMVGRKFVANPPTEVDSEPDLGARLAEIGNAFLNPHVFPRDKHKTVCLNIIFSLSVMLSSLAEKLIEFANRLPFPWFRKQLHHDLAEVEMFWRERLDGPKHEQTIQNLSRLRNLIQID